MVGWRRGGLHGWSSWTLTPAGRPLRFAPCSRLTVERGSRLSAPFWIPRTVDGWSGVNRDSPFRASDFGFRARRVRAASAANPDGVRWRATTLGRAVAPAPLDAGQSPAPTEMCANPRRGDRPRGARRHRWSHYSKMRIVSKSVFRESSCAGDAHAPVPSHSGVQKGRLP